MVFFLGIFRLAKNKRTPEKICIANIAISHDNKKQQKKLYPFYRHFNCNQRTPAKLFSKKKINWKIGYTITALSVRCITYHTFDKQNVQQIIKIKPWNFFTSLKINADRLRLSWKLTKYTLGAKYTLAVTFTPN